MKSSCELYPTWIEVNLSAIEHNTRTLTAMCKVPVMAVVKANAYGHGIIEVSKTVLASGASWLAVSRAGEAWGIREAGIRAPIMILGGVVPAEVSRAIKENLSLPLYDEETARVYSQCAREIGQPVRAHLKVDTGLGRLGVFPEEVLGLAQYAQSLGGIEIEGLFSHFSMSDVKDHPLTPLQLKRFNQALGSLNESGIFPKYVHLANSAACFHVPNSQFTLVRAGQILVGLGTGREDLPFPQELRRAFCWKARLMSSKVFPEGWPISYGLTYTTHAGERIGVIPVGHGDGFRRAPGNQVIIDGEIVNVLGKVCIDQTMIELKKPLPLGTEAVLIGSQGNAHIYPEELTQRWGISVPSITNIDRRVPRVYIRDEE